MHILHLLSPLGCLDHLHELLALLYPVMCLLPYLLPVVVPVHQEEHGRAMECGPAELPHPEASHLEGHLERKKVGKGKAEPVVGHN